MKELNREEIKLELEKLGILKGNKIPMTQVKEGNIELKYIDINNFSVEGLQAILDIFELQDLMKVEE